MARNPVSAVLANPMKYGTAVRRLELKNCPSQSSRKLDAYDSPGNSSTAGGVGPIDAVRLYALFKCCSELEELTWKSSSFPPDGIGEVLAVHTPRLSTFTYQPENQTPSYLNSSQKKWDGPSLPLFWILPISKLHLTGLSLSGSQALSYWLSKLDEESVLEDVLLDFVWLDDSLMVELAKVGRRIRTLQIGTQGTKLTDKGMSALLEGCEALENLSMIDVEGRFSRSLWSNISKFPSGLKSLRIEFTGARQHHSWAADHLSSLCAAPLQRLTRLCITRNLAQRQFEGGAPLYVNYLDEMSTARRVPDDFVAKLRSATSLTTFECDWWSFGQENVKVVLECCLKLESLKLCLDTPFTKLLSLTSTFVLLPQMRKIEVCVMPEHAPGTPTATKPPSSSHIQMPPTPGDSPVLRSKSLLPQLIDLDQLQHPPCLQQAEIGDPSFPALREIRRFARKCAKLELIHWYGENARGQWRVLRPQGSASKIGCGILVEFSPPMLTDGIGGRLTQELDGASTRRALSTNFSERRGQAWVGKMADQLAAEREEKHQIESRHVGEKEKPGKLKDITRRASSIMQQLPSPTNTTLSGAPLQSYDPITPPNSASSIASMFFVKEKQPSCVTGGDMFAARGKFAKHAPVASPTRKPRGGRSGRSSTAPATGVGSDVTHIARRRTSTSGTPGSNGESKLGAVGGLKKSPQNSDGRRKLKEQGQAFPTASTSAHTRRASIF